jgi:hypothetical protein
MPVTTSVLLLLLLMSVGSWYILLLKWLGLAFDAGLQPGCTRRILACRHRAERHGRFGYP